MRRSLAVLVAVALMSSPAAAVADSINTSPGVLFSNCVQKAYTFTVTFPEGTTSYDMDVSVKGRDGNEVSSDYVYGDVTAGEYRGSGSFQICGYEGPGTWTIGGSGTTYDYDYDSIGFTIPASSFRMRAPRSVTRATVTGSAAAPVIKVAVRDERPRGYFATSTTPVVLQQFKKGKWKRVKGSLTYTSSAGRASFRTKCLRSAKNERIRVVTPAKYEDFASSTSKIRRIC